MKQKTAQVTPVGLASQIMGIKSNGGYAHGRMQNVSGKSPVTTVRRADLDIAIFTLWTKHILR